MSRVQCTTCNKWVDDNNVGLRFVFATQQWEPICQDCFNKEHGDEGSSAEQ